MLEPQVLLAMAKSPLAVMDENNNAVLRRFVTVTSEAGLVVPTRRLGKVRLAGETLTGAMPLPERATVWGLFAALSVTMRDEVRLPAPDGVNATEMLQLNPAPSVVGAIGQFQLAA
jgi:hypothetical protein